MRRKIALILAVLWLLVTSACGQTPCQGEAAVFWYSYEDTYLTQVRQIMGQQWGNMTFRDHDAGNDQTAQIRQIQEAIAGGACALVVNLVDTGSDEAALKILALAKEADLPLVFFNRSVSEEIVTSYRKAVFVGTDYIQAGQMQGDMIGQFVLSSYDLLDANADGVISYVLFHGQEGNPEAEARTHYAVSGANAILNAAEKPSMVFYDPDNTGCYLADPAGTWSAQHSKTQMTRILAEDLDVELIIANNDDMALGAIEALQEAGLNMEGSRYIPVFGVDATDAAREKIADGSMTGTIHQDAGSMAETIVAITNNLCAGDNAFHHIDSANITEDWMVNIPYRTYTGQ